jgi:hypothetical protein
MMKQMYVPCQHRTIACTRPAENVSNWLRRSRRWEKLCVRLLRRLLGTIWRRTGRLGRPGS